MKKLMPLTAVFLSLLIALPLAISVTCDIKTPAPEQPEGSQTCENLITENTPETAEPETEQAAETEPETDQPEAETEAHAVTEFEASALEDDDRYLAAPPSVTEAQAEAEAETVPETAHETEAPTEPATTVKPADKESGYKGCDAEYIRVYNSQESKYMNMLLGDYIVCVVAGEMPSRFDVEALKAQAIACRSFTLFRAAKSSCYYSSMHGEKGADVCTNSGHCQAYLPYETALQRWHSKSYTDERFEKIKRAVKETSGIVAAYNGEPIEALYHATSYGYTENYNNNWGGKRPYLCAVPTPETLETAHIVSTDTFTSAEIMKILKKYGDPVFPADKNEWFRLVPNDSGRVGKSDICGVELTGQQMRGIFGLASSKFTVSYNAGTDEFTFDVRGWGHGVGLSQYGAGLLADQGYTCEEIIKHYYTGVELIPWK